MAKKKEFVPSKLAEATKRQYEKKQISIAVVNSLKEKGKLTDEEVIWILKED